VDIYTKSEKLLQIFGVLILALEASKLAPLLREREREAYWSHCEQGLQRQKKEVENFCESVI
jgi:hypothetical protein